MKRVWKWITALLCAMALLTTGLIRDTAFAAEEHSEDVPTGTSEETVTLEDGTYQIFGRLWQATQEIPENWTEEDSSGASMGDGALNHEIGVTVKDGKAVLNLEFVQMTYELFGTPSSGYLSKLNYFPGYEEETAPDGQTPAAAEISSYWEDEDGKRISDQYGTDYPRYLNVPLDSVGQQVVWVQVYVPIMESISTGMGTQYAKLVLDWNDIKEVKEENNSSESTDPANLSDGVYKLDGTMVKVDRQSLSMSNDAIVHKIKLTVKDGVYYATMNFRGLTVGTRLGYLSTLKYFQTGYTLDNYGKPEGDLADVTVDSYQTYEDGSLVSDTYGSNYPDQVTFELIPEAKDDGYVPLQVFVPIMEAISAGTGTQPVFLKLDWTTLAATDDTDPDFTDPSTNTKSTQNGTPGSAGTSATNQNGSGTTGTLSNGIKRNTLSSGSLSGSSLKSSSLSGSSLKSSSLSGGSLKSSSLSGNSLKNSSLSGNSLQKSALNNTASSSDNSTKNRTAGPKTGDEASSETEKWVVIMIMAAFIAFLSFRAKQNEMA